MVYSRGKWFLIGLCERAHEIRIFRVDRMVAVFELQEKAQIPDTFEFAKTLADEQSEELLIVRYSSAIARWIAEREGLRLLPDGSVVVNHPLFDDRWSIGHVLQYGSDAEALAPPRIQRTIALMAASLGD